MLLDGPFPHTCLPTPVAALRFRQEQGIMVIWVPQAIGLIRLTKGERTKSFLSKTCNLWQPQTSLAITCKYVSTYIHIGIYIYIHREIERGVCLKGIRSTPSAPQLS